MKIVKVFCVHELVMESKCNNMHGERIKTVLLLETINPAIKSFQIFNT